MSDIFMPVVTKQSQQKIIDKKTKLFEWDQNQTKMDSDSAILARIDRIYSKIFPLIEPQLHSHLKQIDLAPHIFL